MIATIKSEWRKSRLRPAFLIAAGIMAGITVLVYGVNWYLALHPLATRGGDRAVVNFATLYPDQFVNNVMGAAFPIGAAMAIVVGALFAGSEYGWGTMKTMFTQRPGRLTVWAGRLVVFGAWMLIMTLVLFAVGAISSVVIAAFQGHAITWPAATDLAKGIGAIWLVLMVNGSIGLALGVLIRQPAAALGIGLTYVLAVEIIAVRIINLINNGQFKNVTEQFVNQNATALTQSFTSPAFGISAPSPISADHAVLVLFAYGIGLAIVAAAALRLRDVT
jgi:ABC-type transport system involved in multi-copper enzyme maturation permease subunit